MVKSLPSIRPVASASRSLILLSMLVDQ